MITFIVEIAVSVCRLTVCGSANGVYFYQLIQERKCTNSFICESNNRVSVANIVKKCFNLSMPCTHAMKKSSMYL